MSQTHPTAVWEDRATGLAPSASPAYLVKHADGRWIFSLVGPAEGHMIDTGIAGERTLYELYENPTGTPIDIVYVGGVFLTY